MKFNTKAEYLTWRAEWRANYKELSKQIREIKFARWFTDSARNGVAVSEAQIARYNQIAKQHTTQWGFHPNYVLAKLRAQATAMLEERKQSKVEAQKQYLAGRALRAAA